MGQALVQTVIKKDNMTDSTNETQLVAKIESKEEAKTKGMKDNLNEIHKNYEHNRKIFIKECLSLEPEGSILDLFESKIENVTEVKRTTHGVLKPKSRDQLKALVKLANQYKVNLNVFSTGFNWGFGSSASVTNNCFQLNLSHLNQIIEFDNYFGIIKIEPGVSQKQLAEFLRNQDSNYIIDLTGSSADTSIIGNAMDRGISYYASRSDSIVSMEILLPNGDLIQTGYNNWFNSKIKGHFKYAPGPQLDGLFYQSNYGIVVSVTYQLYAKWSEHYTYSISFNTDQLEKAINLIHNIKKKLPFENLIHLANNNRLQNTVIEPIKHLPETNYLDRFLCHQIPKLIGKGEWILFGSVIGPKELITGYKKIVNKELKTISRVSWRSSKNWNLLIKISHFLKLPLLKEIFLNINNINNISVGQPSNRTILSFITEKNPLLEVSSEEIDQKGRGFIFCVGLSPLKGRDGIEMIEIINQYSKEWKIPIDLTLNALNKNTLESVISIQFNRNKPDEVEKMHRFTSKLQEALINKGFPPYRIGIDKMNLLPKQNMNYKYQKLLKDIFDPNHILSPGKYV